MIIVNKVSMMIDACRLVDGPIGLVPTMGYLHEGHLSLVRKARVENATLAVSIFVNPSQFGSQEDFNRYPRDNARDLSLLEKEGADLVFIPAVGDMYAPDSTTLVHVGEISRRLEGKYRKGHFDGVSTVVAKLFNIVRPDKAYFGQKDGQQIAVIRHMVADLNLSVQIVGMPTIRDADGVAMSSRNIFLTEEERCGARALYRALHHVQGLWSVGQRSAEVFRQEMRRILEEEPIVGSVDYVSVADTETLEELETIATGAMVSVAAHIGKNRLIDNVILGP